MVKTFDSALSENRQRPLAPPVFLSLLLLAAMAFSGVAILREREVADAVSALKARSHLQGADIPPPPFIPADSPPRARLALANAMMLGVRPAARPAEDDRRMLLLAEREALRAAQARAHWPQAWAVVAAARQRLHGPEAEETLAALERSYADGAYLREGSLWRVTAALELWDRLSPAARKRMIDEAVWITRTNRAMRDRIFAQMRPTPAYGPLLLRWREFRLRDADYYPHGARLPE